MNPRVVAVLPRAGYELEITFSNGESGIYDCKPILDFGVFRELSQPGYFKQVHSEGGTIVWPHGQDICPDTVYQQSKKLVK